MSPADNVQVIDVDAHVSEPTDLWTSRLPKKWKDYAPFAKVDEESGVEKWHVGKHTLTGTAQNAPAGWPEPFPSVPPRLSEADPGAWRSEDRLKRMDEYGVFAQVIYPNILGFYGHAFMDMDPELSLACVRAYNDFLTEFCSADPARLIGITAIPFWDVEASVKEIARCADMGHRGINFGWEYQKLGLPVIQSGHWDPILAAAQDLDLAVNFHVGFTSKTVDENKQKYGQEAVGIAKQAALFFVGNAGCIAELIMSGICEQFPRVRFVSVESGFGWVPFIVEAMDWQFTNSSAPKDHPTWLLPSEYFKRQIYATFWFESHLDRQIDMFPDNVMFETDYPHSTSLSPGPGSHAKNARDTIAENLKTLSPELRTKVLHDNAARVYRLS